MEDKLERQDATKAVEEKALEALSGDEDAEDYKEKRAAVQMAFDKLEKETIRKRIAVDKKRPDGRAADEIREIWIEVGVAPAHARLGDLHPRSDAGVLGRRPRHHA